MRARWALGLVLLGAGALGANDADALYEALAVGPGAPHPELAPADLARAEAEVEAEVVDPRWGRRTRWAFRRRGQPWLWVDQDARGAVCHYAVADRDFRVAERGPDGTPRPAAAVEAERAARTAFDLEALEAQARAWLARLDPRRPPRPLERVDAHVHTENPRNVRLVFCERPRAGWRACYPNVHVVSLNPESGEVAWSSGSWVDAGRREAPPVTAAGAETRARQAGPVTGPAELSYRLQGGRPRLVWVVPGEEDPHLVDALTGELRPLGED